MLYSNAINHFHSINTLELLCFFVVPIIFLLLIMKFVFVMTIKFQNQLTNNRFFLKTKIIIVQFCLWFLAQFCLYLLPIQQIVININFFDVNVLPLLSTISFLHLIICFSFLSNNNSQGLKIIRYTVLAVIVGIIFLQFNFTMFNIWTPWFKNLYSLVNFIFFYYCLIFCSWKMFSDNVFMIFNLLTTTWRTLISKTVLPEMFDEQLPIKIYSKGKLILLLWKFEQQSYHAVNDKDSLAKCHTMKLLISTYKKNLIYFLTSQLVITKRKTIQDLKTLINGWKIREIQ